MSEDPKDAIRDLVYGLRAERDAARQQVARLREALEKIVAIGNPPAAVRIARAALAATATSEEEQ